MHSHHGINIFIGISLIISTICSCNSEVFIDDFKPSTTEINLNGDGDSTVVSFAHSNWDILGVISDRSNYPLIGNIYDDKGTFIKKDQLLSCKGLCRLTYDDGLTDFQLVRDSYDKLKIHIGENARRVAIPIIIYVGNQYEEKAISLNISPSGQYILDKIVYSSEDLQQYTDIVATDSITVNNQGKDTITIQWKPYEGQYRSVSFTSEDPTAFKLLGNNPVPVRLPYLVNGKMVQDDKGDIGYYPGTGHIGQSFPDVTKDIKIPPFSTRTIYHLIEYQVFWRYYTLNARNQNSGKERTVTGIFTSRLPIGYFAAIHKIEG
jgi:hypothetical protein